MEAAPGVRARKGQCGRGSREASVSREGSWRDRLRRVIWRVLHRGEASAAIFRMVGICIGFAIADRPSLMC